MNVLTVQVPEPYAERAAALATSAAGGATLSGPAEGYWTDEVGDTLAEPVRTLTVYADDRGTYATLQLIKAHLIAHDEQAVAYSIIAAPGSTYATAARIEDLT